MASESVFEQQAVRVTDIAATKRASKEQQEMIKRLRHSALDDLVAYAGDPAQRDAVLDKVAQINELERQVASTAAGFAALVPAEGKGPLPEAAKREMFGLYLTNRYTQTDLGEQYNISQPSVAEILKKQRARFLAERED
ncbi:hypothetical protein [Pseudomonas fluorescens]|uniref:hypothetical protein n=1 Tax=Pseudomonas fluorescens TaxID=294 RepID=UPI0012429877|nr:hypothetical protein [Pseudomonas fluorescens]